MFWLRFAIALLLPAMAFAQTLPVGIAIPIMLSSDLNAKKDEAGKKMDGKVMQNVPLLSGQIDKGSRVSGHVVSVTKPASSGSAITVEFDSIQDGGRTISLTTALVALASMSSVADAQLPINNTGESKDSADRWVTRQVGGDVVNRQEHMAGSPGGAMGTWLQESSVLIKLTPNPDAGCPDGPGYKGTQAVWIFSSSACGTYGMDDVVITSAGTESPIGEIMLGSSQNVNIRGGSGWLLMTIVKN
jgi:hypothetical protein